MRSGALYVRRHAFQVAKVGLCLGEKGRKIRARDKLKRKTRREEEICPPLWRASPVLGFSPFFHLPIFPSLYFPISTAAKVKPECSPRMSRCSAARGRSTEIKSCTAEQNNANQEATLGKRARGKKRERVER